MILSESNQIRISLLKTARETQKSELSRTWYLDVYWHDKNLMIIVNGTDLDWSSPTVISKLFISDLIFYQKAETGF